MEKFRRVLARRGDRMEEREEEDEEEEKEEDACH